jgi:hypothetical protein
MMKPNCPRVCARRGEAKPDAEVAVNLDPTKYVANDLRPLHRINNQNFEGPQPPKLERVSIPPSANRVRARTELSLWASGQIQIGAPRARPSNAIGVGE